MNRARDQRIGLSKPFESLKGIRLRGICRSLQALEQHLEVIDCGALLGLGVIAQVFGEQCSWKVAYELFKKKT